MKIPTLKAGDAIEVIWIDSHFVGDKGWMSKEEAVDETREIIIRSVCQYLAKDKQYLYTVADRSQTDDGVMRDLKVPLGCIKSIRRLK